MNNEDVLSSFKKQYPELASCIRLIVKEELNQEKALHLPIKTVKTND